VIFGIGVDIVDIERMEAAYAAHGDDLLERIFSVEERTFCDTKSKPAPHYAARYAAKEAVLKAFGTGLRGELCFKDIVVVKDDLGAPSVILRNRAKELAEEMGISGIFLSISHEKKQAVAFVVMEKSV
jgi:holo-[acyl-carrier protein] synthase